MRIELMRLKTDTTLEQQIEKVCSEAIEFMQEKQYGTAARRNEELFDLLQAVLGLLDKIDLGIIGYNEYILNKKLTNRGWETTGKWLIESKSLTMSEAVEIEKLKYKENAQ
jgi:hypothetical protein